MVLPSTTDDRNLLNPVYTVNGETHQDDEHTHPKLLHRKLDKPSYALQTKDIEVRKASRASASCFARAVE